MEQSAHTCLRASSGEERTAAGSSPVSALTCANTPQKRLRRTFVHSRTWSNRDRNVERILRGRKTAGQRRCRSHEGDTQTTIDDALEDGPEIVGEIAAEIADERGLPRDWLAHIGNALEPPPQHTPLSVRERFGCLVS